MLRFSARQSCYSFFSDVVSNVDMIINGFADVREERGFDCADLGLCASFISEISPKSPAKASAQIHHQRLRNGQSESCQLI